MTIPPLLSMFPTSPQRSEAPRPMFSTLAVASSGLSAQRARMDIIAQNLANAETTKTPQGGPYQRRVVNLEAIEPTFTTSTTLIAPTGATTTSNLLNASPAAASMLGVPSQMLMPMLSPMGMVDDTGGVRVASIGVDKTEGPMIYNPGSPDANENGYVKMPNVNMTEELMDLMNSRRLYEANATVFQVARAMLHKAIDI
ncbi:MAG TPA: flagellar basal body rod protein FlgC [Gemmatimonadaceae bacterium]|nr:flagellar basal body rod protein FlgC [Gemmatimonadaceae bacterium]